MLSVFVLIFSIHFLYGFVRTVEDTLRQTNTMLPRAYFDNVEDGLKNLIFSKS